MPSPAQLSQPQRVVLADLLQARLAELHHERAVQSQGPSATVSARQTLLQDADDATQLAGVHEVEERLADMQDDEIDAISSALHRINGMGYGLCVECQAAIGFARLQIEPQALRCLSCQTIHEGNPTP